jgi:hypothetical protein
MHGDDDLADDFNWAATELWLATGGLSYRSHGLASTHQGQDVFDPGACDFGHDLDPALAPPQSAG